MHSENKFELNFILDHKRFKRNFKDNELKKLTRKDRVVQFPVFNKPYYEFFQSYAKKNYKLVENKCLCGKDDDLLLSLTDRDCVSFKTVVCKGCGLIRA